MGRDSQIAVVGQRVQCWTGRPEVTGLWRAVSMSVAGDRTYTVRVWVVVVRVNRRSQHGRDWAGHDNCGWRRNGIDA